MGLERQAKRIAKKLGVPESDVRKRILELEKNGYETPQIFNMLMKRTSPNQHGSNPEAVRHRRHFENRMTNENEL